MIHAQKHDTSPQLKDLEGNNESGQHEALVPVHQASGQTPVASGAVSGDPVLQRTPVRAAGPTLAGSFEGMGSGLPGYTVTYFPPDVNGAIGPNHYVQVVNASVAVFSRTGTLLMAPKPISTLWTGFGGLCETTNGGDPTAVYDRAADRWLVSQIAYAGANGTTVPYLNCVAISTTNNPTGAYYRYAFPRSTLPDYAKFSVWPDAYYMTDNDQQNGNYFVGAAFGALDRSAMLVGGPATLIVYNLGTSYASLLSAGQDGPTSPPAGAPGYALALGADMASLNLWRLHADFRTPASSTLTGPFSIPVAPFRQLCNGLYSCVPQAAPGSDLASLGDRLMYRASYRNFGDHESLVAGHSVDPGQGGNLSGGLRWYEVRNPGATPALYQQGTFAPDSNYRWMGSVAMDARGDIGAGYSLSGINTIPSVALTGRLAGDTLGTMPQGETIMVAGTGVQTNIDRWGDYTSMSVDPLDDCTFWYTNQYLATTGAPWRTRVGSFKFASCTLARSSIALTSSPNPSTGGPVTLSAIVTGAAATPTGTVQFQDGQTVLGTAALSAGNVTLSVSLLGGTRSLTAVYSGDSVYSGSSSPIVTQTVNLPATTTALAASPTATYAANPITFTATVSGGSGTLTGSVTFFDGNLTMGSAALSARTASLTTSALAVGGHNVTATYSGDTANAASTSTAVSVTVSGPNYSLLYSFTGGADSGAPQLGVTQGRDGAFYGVTNLQGSGMWGTIFRYTPAGLTTLHTLTTADGAGSYSRLMVGLDGALWGTSAGLAPNNGSIWRITSQGAFSVVHYFSGPEGVRPSGGLVQDSAGTMYGVTSVGGVYDHGTVYAVTPAGALRTLYSFTGLADGNGPRGTLVFGRDGNLYGFTEQGGTKSKGAIFRITTAGVLTTLYSFTGAADGLYPQAGLVLGGDGNFYGTSSGGTMGRGTIFRITPAGVLTTLYQFGPGDGSAGLSTLVQDAKGTLYGEAVNSGPGSYFPQHGTLFQLTPNGTFVVLRAMDFRTGNLPIGGMTIAQDGNLYGTASSGAAATWGGIFSLSLASPLTLTPATLSNLTEGLNSSMTVAQVSGGGAPYSVSINWGDGITSTSTMASSGAVTGTHTWVDESPPGLPYTVTVTVTDALGSTATVRDTATVADAALSAGPAVNITGSEDVDFSGTVATFSDANPGAPLSDFTATISWGDGTSSAGTVSGTGPYTVTGSHTYLEGGSYATSVAIKDIGGSTLTVFGTATISDYPLYASGVADDTTSIFSGTVGYLSDDDPTATVSEYTVTIDWGDGTSTGGVAGGTSQPFTLSGSHTYAATGVYNVTVSVRDTGGATATTTSTLNVTDLVAAAGGPMLV